eukprot:12926281-Prorocentrum_lima.AAC.1
MASSQSSKLGEREREREQCAAPHRQQAERTAMTTRRGLSTPRLIARSRRPCARSVRLKPNVHLEE